MYNTSLRILKDRQEAEDILQESFLTAFDKINQFQSESSFGNWLKKIVINKSINKLKTKKITLVDDNLLQTLPEEEEQSNAYNQFDVIKLNQLIKELPEGYRVILSLYLFEGYDHEEIGEVLKISPSTSRSQYLRAKQKLKKQFLKE